MGTARRNADKALFDALAAEDLDAVRAALAAGADPDAERRKRSALATALAAGQADAARLLLAAGADPGSAREHVLWAVSEPLATLQRFLERGADPDAETYAGRPLQVAARAGLLPQLEALLAAGADPDAGTLLGNPLSDALRHDQLPCALTLLRHGATPAAAAAFGPLLPELVELGRTAALPALLDAGVAVDTRYTLHGPHPRLRDQQAEAGLAALLAEDDEDDDEDFEAFKARIEAGLDDAVKAATAVRQAGVTLLMLAAHEGQADTVALLLARGADAGLRDDQGMRASDFAARAGHQALAAQLAVAAGAADDTLSPDTALGLAIERGDLSGITAALEAGAALEAADTRAATAGQTPLVLAVRSGSLAAVRLLLARGAEVDRAASPSPHNVRAMFDGESQQRTPLHWAAALDSGEIVQALLAAGAAVDARDEDRATPLHLAARGGAETALALLLANRAARDARDRHNDTPLLLAAAHRRRAAALALLAAGANPRAADRERVTALHHAVGNGDVELTRALIAAGADPEAANKYGATPAGKARGKARLTAALRGEAATAPRSRRSGKSG